MFIAVMKVEGDRVVKFADFPTAGEANQHVAAFPQYTGAFVAEPPIESNNPIDWRVSGSTLVYDSTEFDKRTALEAAETTRQSDVSIAEARAVVNTLRTARPAQIDTYIDNNVTDLASAKEVLKDLAVCCAYALRLLNR